MDDFLPIRILVSTLLKCSHSKTTKKATGVTWLTELSGSSAWKIKNPKPAAPPMIPETPVIQETPLACSLGVEKGEFAQSTVDNETSPPSLFLGLKKTKKYPWHRPMYCTYSPRCAWSGSHNRSGASCFVASLCKQHPWTFATIFKLLMATSGRHFCKQQCLS